MVLNVSTMAGLLGWAPVSQAGTTVTVAAASTTDRRDLVVWTQGVGFQVIEGPTPPAAGSCLVSGWTRAQFMPGGGGFAPPLKPDPPTISGPIPANSLPLYEVAVGGGVTSIPAIALKDKRPPVVQPAASGASVFGQAGTIGVATSRFLPFPDSTTLNTLVIALETQGGSDTVVQVLKNGSLFGSYTYSHSGAVVQSFSFSGGLSVAGGTDYVQFRIATPGIGASDLTAAMA
jgi:hypothetical protein